MVQREDLAAAEAVGLLHGGQVDPLLVFLLQRDLLAKRRQLTAPTHAANVNATSVLLVYLAGMLAMVTAALFAVLFSTRMVEMVGIGALFGFTLLYGAGALGLASWFRQRGFGMPLRVLTALLVALAPVAVYSLQ